MDELRFRDARADDAGRVIGWFEGRAAALAWTGPSAPDPLTAEWLVGEIADPTFVHRTAADGMGAVLGFYGLRLAPVERRGHLMRVGVAPERRRRGLGARLLDDAVTTAKARGLIDLTLFVYDSNPTAGALYARLGWVEVERLPAPEDPSGAKRLMRLDIAPAQAASLSGLPSRIDQFSSGAAPRLV